MPSALDIFRGVAATVQPDGDDDDDDNNNNNDSTFWQDVIYKKARILVVGAGGIGCELLKNLALMGFRHVHVIDLDTIDVSNLNRQLLFRRPHVGQAKSVVACHVAGNMAHIGDDTDSNILYVAHHGNVCDNQTFSTAFVETFDLVLNALDNVTARRRVNRICLAASVPLVEAGTTGYHGQVTVLADRVPPSTNEDDGGADTSAETASNDISDTIQPYNVACYECKPQEAPKVYPICTIRSTPSMPVHTVVWAKELYRLLFATQMVESMLYEAIDESGGDKHGEDLQGQAESRASKPAVEGDSGEIDVEPSTYMPAVLAFRDYLKQCRGYDDATATTAVTAERISVLTRDLLTALYVNEIEKQLGMNRYKAARKTPTVLSMEMIDAATTPKAIQQTAISYQDQSPMAVWSLSENVSQFATSLYQAASTGSTAPPTDFDKDCDLAMRLVTAASNLRSWIFSIEPALQSLYAIKGIAGNIIPAIATTNAIVAGIQVLQAVALLKAQWKSGGQKSGHASQHCCYVNCMRNPTRNGLYLTATSLEKPNPACFVCQKSHVTVTLNLHHWTLHDLLQRIIKKELGFEEPTIMLDGDIIWEEGNQADSDSFQVNLGKFLSNLPAGGIQDGTTVSIEDFSQDLTVDVVLKHQETWPTLPKGEEGNEEELSEEEIKMKFIVGGAKPIAKLASVTNDSLTAAAAAAVSSVEDTAKTSTAGDASVTKFTLNEKGEIVLLDDDHDIKNGGEEEEVTLVATAPVECTKRKAYGDGDLKKGSRDVPYAPTKRNKVDREEGAISAPPAEAVIELDDDDDIGEPPVISKHEGHLDAKRIGDDATKDAATTVAAAAAAAAPPADVIEIDDDDDD